MSDTIAPSSPHTDGLNDFSDRLSPMLVKELRQGMRAKLFVTVFLALQALLALILLISILGSYSMTGVGTRISGIIFMFFAFAALIIQPLRGIGALHREIQHLTLELIVLTRLSAWKIVLGKWISLASQTVLIAAAVIPYLVLRYWFGEMNLFGEISLFFIILILSIVATAVVVGLSCVPSVILRGLAPLLLGGIGMISIPNLAFGYEFNEIVEVASMQTSGTLWGVILVLLGAIYLGWLCLSIAVSLIAPAVENHATIRRLISLGLLLILTILLAFEIGSYVDSDVWITLVVLIATPAIVLAVTESFILLPPLYRPFYRKRIGGRLAASLFAPGWPSGVVFSFFVLLLSAYLITGDHFSYPAVNNQGVNVLLGLVGFFLMPAAVLLPLARRIKSLLTFFMLIVAIFGVILFVTALIVDSFNSQPPSALWLFSWLPPIGLCMAIENYHYSTEALTIVLLISNGIYALLIAVVTMPRLFEMFAFLRTCENDANASPDTGGVETENAADESGDQPEDTTEAPNAS